MPNCYFFPGFGGSELWTTGGYLFSPVQWANYSQLLLGSMDSLRLGPDGVTPDPPDEPPLYANAILDAYYGDALRALAVSPLMQGYTILHQYYDWRLDFLSHTPAAIAHIEANVTPDNPCALVGHSFGGLIARIVWSRVNAAGKGNLIRRVVTLGTPHYGSYQALRLFSNDDDTLTQLSLLTSLGTAFRAAIDKDNPTPKPAQSPSWNIALFCTWPSVYDSLPVPGAPDAGDDPLRAALYVPANYVGVPVEANWLRESLEVNGPWLLSSANVPPYDVFTAIAATGFPTVDQLRLETPLGNPGVYNTGGDGDGVVTRASAIGPAQVSYVVHQRHNDLTLATTLSGLLPRAIVEGRPTPPEPSHRVERDTPQPLLGGPPFTPLDFARSGGAGGTGGLC